jgi:hypothetical protein
MREIHDLSGAGGTPAALFGFAPPSASGAPGVRTDQVLQQLAELFGPTLPEPTEVLVQDWRTELHTSPPGVERLQDYEWLDGELVAGLALGWNFGDGHLHQEQLLESLQRQCGFEEGEVRCVFVESQPIHVQALAWRIVDAKSGRLAQGSTRIEVLRAHQAWSTRPA